MREPSFIRWLLCSQIVISKVFSAKDKYQKQKASLEFEFLDPNYTSYSLRFDVVAVNALGSLPFWCEFCHMSKVATDAS
jgi:hypothetical protein